MTRYNVSIEDLSYVEAMTVLIEPEVHQHVDDIKVTTTSFIYISSDLCIHMRLTAHVYRTPFECIVTCIHDSGVDMSDPVTTPHLGSLREGKLF